MALSLLGFALTGSRAEAATVTIGQINPFLNAVAECGSQADLLQPTVTSGPSYVVPPGGAQVTSWITNAGTNGAGNGQVMAMKIFRFISDVGPTYRVVGHDGGHLLHTGLNTFPTNIAVQPGDVLGLNDVNASSPAPEACWFGVPGDTYLGLQGGDLSDGHQGSFASGSDERLNIQAVIQLAPGATPTGANAFSFGKTKDNTKNGTATITVKVPGPGAVDLSGTGVKPLRTARASGAVASEKVTASGAVKLLVKPKGKTKQKLNKTGKAKVKVSVTYTPTGGNPATQSERLKLIKKQ